MNDKDEERVRALALNLLLAEQERNPTLNGLEGDEAFMRGLCMGVRVFLAAQDVDREMAGIVGPFAVRPSAFRL